METELRYTLLGDETLKIFADREPMITRSWCDDAGRCKITVPLPYFDLVKQLAPAFIQQCVDAVSFLPDASLIERIVIVPKDELRSTYLVQEISGRYSVLIELPYTGVSLRRDLLEAYAEILAELFPVSRYLFELAYILQPKLKEESPTFINSGNLWNYIIANLASDPLTDTELKTRPLLTLSALDAIVRSLEHSGDKVNLQVRAKFDSMKERLQQMALLVVLDKLLHLSNESDNDDARQASCKLLLHLGGAQHIGRIKNIKSLRFCGEPVGESVLSQLQYLTCIQELDLSDTFFPSEALRHLAQLPQLSSLNLQNTRAHNNAVIYLSKSNSLARLDCSFTQIADDGAKHFLSFKNLKQLDLTGTQVSDKMCELLKQGGISLSI
jgi:hypothetical protein